MAKITEEQLQRLDLIRQDALEATSILGQIEYQRVLLEISAEEQKQVIKDIRNRESDFLDEIKAQYGNINLNLETGEYS